MIQKEKNNNILVTGGAGFIGSAVANELVKKKYSVIVIDDLSNGKLNFLDKKVKFYKLNISESKKIGQILESEKINVVFHFAGKIYADESIRKKKEYYLNNFIYPKNFFNLCLKYKVKNFIFASTAGVYGEKKKIFRELDKTNPINPYSQYKLMFENFLIKKSTKKMNYAILRYFNVCGANIANKWGQVNNKRSVMRKISIAIIKKKIKKFTIYGKDHPTLDGTPARDFIHINDLVDIHLKVLDYLKKNKKSILLNCGYGKSFTIKKIIDLFKKISKKKIDIEYSKRRKGDPSEVIANNLKLKKTIKFKAKYDKIYFMVKSSLDWEKKLIKKGYEK